MKQEGRRSATSAASLRVGPRGSTQDLLLFPGPALAEEVFPCEMNHGVGFTDASRQALVRPVIASARTTAHWQDDVSCGFEAAGERRADEAGRAGDQDLHGRSFLCFLAAAATSTFRPRRFTMPPLRNDSAIESARPTSASRAFRRSRKIWASGDRSALLGNPRSQVFENRISLAAFASARCSGSPFRDRFWPVMTAGSLRRGRRG